MFGRLYDVRLKAAEQALAAGRLDEAFEAAAAIEFVDRKQAVRLLDRLFEPLITRAQEHLLAGRFREAMDDLKRAERCNTGEAGSDRNPADGGRGRAERVADWRRRAVSAMEDHQRREQAERAAIDAAADGLAKGALTRAGEHLERVDPAAQRREQLSDEIAAAQQRAQRLAEEARTAMNAEQYVIAADRLVAARRNHAGSATAMEVGDALAQKLVARVRESLAAGQLDKASHDLDLARRVNDSAPQVVEATRALGWIREAAARVEAGEYDDAITLLGRFTQLAGAAAWAKRTRDNLEEIRTRLAEVVAGPLGVGVVMAGRGLQMAVSPPAEHRVQVNTLTGAHAKPPEHKIHVPPIVDASGLPRRLVLRIDGVGSYLLLRSDRIVIGRAGGSADVPIQADLSERHAEILRSGDDYLLLGQAGVELAGEQVHEALLSHGDRVRLGKRVRLTFERPSRKSGSAVLTMGEGVKSMSDVKRVILWSGPILLGPTTDCHIPVHGLLTGMMLVERGGKIQLRPMGPGGVGQVIPVALGQVAEAGPMRFSVQAV